jgi:hypothetical protein
VARIVDNASVKVHKLLAAALLVALEVVTTGAAVVAHGTVLAGAKGNVGALTQGHREVQCLLRKGWGAFAVFLQSRHSRQKRLKSAY